MMSVKGACAYMQLRDLAENVCFTGTFALQVLIIGGNPAVHSNSFEDHIARARAARPGLDIAWQATDPGQAGA